MYSRENGWELVYSNLHFQGDAAKYFAIYNKFTGILRFFFFSAPGTSSISNTNATLIGFKLNNTNRLFNFTSSLPYAMDRTFNQPTFIFSPSFSFVPTGKGNKIVSGGTGIGYEHEKWYAAEIECSYDPTLASGSTLDLIITALQTTVTTSEGYAEGNIKGNITTQTPTNGWGSANSLPLPGTIANGTPSTPIYNKPLGAWNINFTPKVKIHATMVGGYFENSNDIQDAYIETSFEYVRPIVIFNEEVTNVYNVTNIKVDFATTYSKSYPSGFYFSYENGQEVFISNNHLQSYGYFTTQGNNVVTENYLYSGSKIYQYFSAGGASVEWFQKYSLAQHTDYIYNEMKNRFYCRVRFDLRNKTTNEVDYSFSKYFKADCEIAGVTYRMVRRVMSY